MTAIEVYSYEGDERLTKLQVIANFAGADIQITTLNLDEESTSESFKLNCHPLGKVPIAKTSDGYLFESNAIARYIARTKATNTLYGNSAYNTAQIDQWLDFVSNELEPAVKVLVGLQTGFLASNKEQEDSAWRTVTEVLGAVEQQLEVRTFLVGERISIADICLASLLEELLRVTQKSGAVKEHTCVLRHLDTMINQPEFSVVLKARKPLKKAEEKPAEEPKKEAAVAEEAPVDPFSNENSKEKGMKKALDSLPPSPTFVMDEFKRCYSNNDTRAVAAPFFFDKYDPEGYTCLWSKYKYNDELGPMVFMTSNLVGGMFQRMEALHKYVFGSVLIIGKEKEHEIVGFWVVRGRGMPELMRAVDDVEHHEWSEIANIHDEKEKIIDYLACDGNTFADKPVLDCKTFK